MAAQPDVSAIADTVAPPATVRIGMVGSGYMAKTHSLAYAAATMLHPDDIPAVATVRIADISESLAEQAAHALGWTQATTDWRDITRSPDIDVVDVVTPNFAHADIALDAATQGKHVLCEKPLAVKLADARAMYRAVRDAGVASAVGFVFRTWPAMQLAKKLIEDGRIGRVLSLRAHYFHDYGLNPAEPISWRLRRDTAGGGSVADLGSHVFDLARLLVGEIDRVLCSSRTIIDKRPDPANGGNPATVDVDDESTVLLEFAEGATGVVQTSWVAAGYKTDLAFEVFGTGGALRFTWRRNGELQFYDASDPERLQGDRSIVIGPAHPGAAPFWAVAGAGLGYGDAFTILLSDFLRGLTGRPPAVPTFLDGVRAAEIVAAAQDSAESESWTPVDRMSADN